MRERKTPSKFIIATGAFFLVACSDGPIAPARPALPAQGAAAIVSSTSVGDTVVTVMSINAWAKQTASFDFGTYKLVIPANAICAVATSSYGSSEWDQPCLPETGTVIITAKAWTDSAGHARTDFQPHMRFNPAADPVTLTLRDRISAQAGYGMLYCPDFGACYDESVNDPSVMTYRSNGSYVRRVKHFSGYWVTTGTSMEMSAEAL